MKTAKYLIPAALFCIFQASYGSAITYNFGDTPYQYIDSVASQYQGTCGLNKNDLIAYFLAPTWGESAGLLKPDYTKRWAAPSPMTLGRKDTGDRLLPPEKNESGAVWHPGIGTWQLDDNGIGSSAKPEQERFDSSTATMLVASGMIDRLTTAKCKTTNIFSPWGASCGDNYSLCFARHDAILKILNSGMPVPTESVDRFGGSELHQCSLGGHTMSCLYVNHANAQPKDETRNWSDPLPTAPLKLAKPFYVFHVTGTAHKVTYEWRYWLAADTLNGYDIAARRADGQDSRLNLCWISAAQGELSDLPNCQLSASSLGLCDLGAVGPSGLPEGPQRGSCSGLSVALTATPNSGSAPLNNVTLQANVTGTPNETINYTFYCNRPDLGTNITQPWDKKMNALSRTQVRVPNLCNYPTAGQYTAKIIVEQGTGAAESRVPITVGSSISCFPLTLSVNNPSGGGAPTASPSNSSGCSTGQYTAGQSIQLTASPATGWSVGSWIGTQSDTSTSTTNSLIMPASSHSVTVNYIQQGTGGAPSLSGESADAVTTNSATLHAFVNPNGLPTNVSFQYGTGVPPSFTSTPSQNIGMGRQSVPFSANLGNLACGQTYTYYASATNSAGTSTGLPETFDTFPCGSNGLSIVTSNLPKATIGSSYSASLTASGGTPGYTWSFVTAPQDPTIHLSANGTLSGPTTLANDCVGGATNGGGIWLGNGYPTSNFTVQVRDAAGLTVMKQLCLVSYYPTPQVASISPHSVTINGQQQSVSVNGGNFRPNAAIQFGAPAVSIPTTYSSASSLGFTLYPSISSPLSFSPSGGNGTGAGTFPVAVAQPDSDLPPAINFSIYAPAPSLSGVSANLASTNQPCTANASCQLVINGNGFLTSDVTSFLIVETNSALSEASAPATPMPWSQVTTTAFSVPAGTYTLRVTNQAQPSGAPASAAMTFVVQPQPPSPVSIYEIYPQWTTGDYLGIFWTKNADDDFLSYRIYRASHAGVTTADTLVAEITNQAQVYYKDAGLTAADYYYRVFTVSQTGQTAGSNEVQGKVFAPSEVISRIPGVPEPGDTGFPSNVAVPDNVSALQIYDCPRDPMNPENCLGGYSVVSDDIDAEGDLTKRRHFSVSITNNLLNGVNDLQFIFHQFDIWDADFSAIDDTYQITTSPALAFSLTVGKGTTHLLEGQISPGTTGGIFVQNSAGATNNTAGAVESVP